MPILSGLVFAASVAVASQDDLINDKHYVVVKSGEQGAGSAPPASAVAGQASGAGTTLPASHEVPVSIKLGQTEIAPMAEFPVMGQMLTFAGSSQLRQMPEFAKSVSCSFVDASSSDVLKWLSKQGVNFAGASDSMPKGKLSLNLKNVPLHEALESIAEVFGGSWNVRGKTLVFRSGPSLAFAAPARSMIAPLRGRVDPKRPYEIPMPAMPPMPPMNIEGFEFKFDEKALKELAKVHEISGALSKGEMAKVQKEMAKANEEMKKAMEMSKADGAKPALVFGGPNQDFAKLMKSLTDSQWDLHKKQGYLKFSDLTKDQLRMISQNGKVEGSVTINVSIDGKSLTLKN